MSTERQYGWMWQQACDLLDQADRLHRQVHRYMGRGADAALWEPPVDVQETEEGVILQFALPGVAPEEIEIRHEPGALTVIAARPLKLATHDAVIRRLEIPHGRFVRRIALAGAAWKVADTAYTHGCLEVRLVRAGEDRGASGRGSGFRG
jgi:HSP20 family molecular chaperone IbpA